MTEPQRARFLELIRANPTIGNKTAARQAGASMTSRAIDELLADDPDFAADYRDARGRGDETIRAEIRRRALDGVDEPVFHQGVQVATVRRYSDRLLTLMAKAQLPEYQDRTSLELTGPGGGPVQIEKREVSLQGVLHVLADAGALPQLGDAGPLAALAAARPLLPPQPD